MLQQQLIKPSCILTLVGKFEAMGTVQEVSRKGSQMLGGSWRNHDLMEQTQGLPGAFEGQRSQLLEGGAILIRLERGEETLCRGKCHRKRE